MRYFTLILAIFFVQAICFPQNIAVENFKHHKHYFWQLNSSLPLDKKNAVVALNTDIKGFLFQTVKGLPIEAEEADHGLILKVPDKTKFIIISHPEFGSFQWRVPEKSLKKHNFYSANLLAADLAKEFTNPNQWVVFNISPENSILTLDSAIYRISDGKASFYLPVGKHDFKVESPFYESFADSILLTGDRRLEKEIFLQPLYSYISVRTGDPDVNIFIDDILQGRKEVTLGRMMQGDHRISLLKNDRLIKDTVFALERAEKKTLFFHDLNSSAFVDILNEKIEKNPSRDIYLEMNRKTSDPELIFKEINSFRDTLIFSDVHLIAEDSLFSIYVDREFKGIGEWKGVLPIGWHLITTEKDGRESLSQYITLNDSSPLQLNLNAPSSSSGSVNIYGNVDGAEVRLGNEFLGFTPCVVSGLAANEIHTLTISKAGYVTKEYTVRPKANDIVNLDVTLKKKKKR